MKRMILITGMLFLLGGVVSAQTTGSNSTNGTTHSSPSESTKKKKGKKVRYNQLNQRKNYNWKSGQQATPTGQEATPVGGGFSSLRKDTSTVVNEQPKKEE